MENLQMATIEVTDYFTSAMKGEFPFKDMSDLHQTMRRITAQLLGLNLSEDLLVETLRLIESATDKYRSSFLSLNEQ